MKKIKGLLLKDILQTKSYFISNCLLCLLFCVLFVFQIFAFKNGGSGNGYNTGMPEETPNDLEILQSALFSSFFYFCIFPIYSCSGIALSFQQDERCNFDKFAISSGIKRDVIVFEKTVFGGVVAIPGLFLTLLACIFLSFLQNNYATPLLSIYFFINVFSGYLISIIVSLVLCTFLGSVKGRIWTSIATILTFILQSAVFGLYIMFGLDNVLISSLITFIYLAIAVGVFIGGFFLARAAYRNKEF